MNKRLTNIKVCDTCFSLNLEYIKNYEHEDIMLSSMEEAVMRTDDVVLCKDCDSIYYMEDNKIYREFALKVTRESRKLNWVSDYEVAKSKIKI